MIHRTMSERSYHGPTSCSLILKNTCHYLFYLSMRFCVPFLPVPFFHVPLLLNLFYWYLFTCTFFAAYLFIQIVLQEASTIIIFKNLFLFNTVQFVHSSVCSQLMKDKCVYCQRECLLHSRGQAMYWKEYHAVGLWAEEDTIGHIKMYKCVCMCVQG